MDRQESPAAGRITRYRISTRVTPPESKVAAWWSARSPGETLRTSDGQPLAIICPGRPGSHGPDFQDAVMTIGGHRLCGAVEFHRRSSDWVRHRHHADPAYEKVILHVAAVLDQPVFTMSGRKIPQVPANLSKSPSLTISSYPCGQRSSAWRCEVVITAGKVRLERKAATFRRRLALLPQETALRAGLARALGYTLNMSPMEQLAAALPASISQFPLPKIESELFARAAAFPKGSWHTRGVRPQNHPRQRILALARLLAKYPEMGLSARVLDFFRTLAGPTLSHSIEKLLTVPGYIGKGRAREMAVNIAVPLSLALALDNADGCLAERARLAWASWPSLPENNITRHLKSFLGIKTGSGSLIQQGLLHVYHEYCRVKECAGCPLHPHPTVIPG